MGHLFPHHEDHEGHEVSDIYVFKLRALRVLLRKLRWGRREATPKSSPPNVLIGGPVRIPPGFPLKACGNDGLVGELRLGSKTCSIFILCGRASYHESLRGEICILSLFAPCRSIANWALQAGRAWTRSRP